MFGKHRGKRSWTSIEDEPTASLWTLVGYLSAYWIVCFCFLIVPFVGIARAVITAVWEQRFGMALAFTLAIAGMSFFLIVPLLIVGRNLRELLRRQREG
jgi:hypothetical protein